MTTVLAKVTLEATEWSDDSAVNTFALHTEGNVSLWDDLDGVEAAVADFYRAVPAGGTAAVGTYLSSQLNRAANTSRVDLYDITDHLSGSPAGSPKATSFFTLPAAGTPAQLPSQVASVLTLRGRGALLAPVEGPFLTRPRQRLSGRLFIGPLGANAGEAGTAGVGDFARPEGTFVNNALFAAEALQDALGALGWIWCVWSRTTANVHGITDVSMDNAWDVLRSRKHSPNTRTARVFAPVPSIALGA